MIKEATALVARLRQARDAYYNGQPTMSDAAFDVLEDNLRKLAPEHAYFGEVGAAPVGGWLKAKHRQPMGSLDKAQNSAEVQAWINRCGLTSEAILITEKLDGASISLCYENGRLRQAVTRGDGLVGDDITRNVKLMKGVPVYVKGFTGQVRSEVVCLRSDFTKHFKDKGYSNPRNTANGIMKRQDDPEPCRHLTVISYQVMTDGHVNSCKSGELCWLVNWGFVTPHFELTNRGVQAIQQTYEGYIKSRREELNYDIDGLVLYVDSHRLRSELGEHNMRPKGAVAFKFPHDEKVTVLRAVDWQVGPSGRITPVAKFDPIDLSGAQVKQASLHNPSYIERLTHGGPLFVGDEIMVSRRNDVIPYVEALFNTSGGSNTCDTPSRCPSCGAFTERDGEYLVCINVAGCRAQVNGAIKRWITKLDVKDFGETLIEALCDSGMVETVADLYRLDEKEVARLEFKSGRVCGLATSKLALKNLRSKMELPLETLVGSLGIPLWGRSMVKLLVEAGYDDLDALHKANGGDDIFNIPGVGQTKGEAFFKGLSTIMPVIEELLDNGITIAKPSSGHLKGTTMCMTGVRDGALAEAFEKHGGSVKGSVGRGLTYLVAADSKGTSGKLNKARELGTKVVSLDEMWKLVKNGAKR